MKKLILAMSVLFAILFVTPGNSAVSTNESGISSFSADKDWKKSPSGIWEGMKNDKTYWYKLDKNAKLWWSVDGKEWMEVADGMWMDKDGRWLKIQNKKLVWSADMGKTWDDVPEWKWQGSDGKWYKFDKDWALWIKG